MMLNFFFPLGPLPSPDGYETQVSPLVGHFIFAAYLLGFATITLLYCSEGFRGFVERHVCAWMEKHAVNKSDETKGGL